MTDAIELLADVGAVVGEGPVWDGTSGVLYWTDIHTGRLFVYNPSTNENRQIHSGVNVGGLRVNRAGGLTLGTWEGVMLWRSDDDWAWLRHGSDYGEDLRFNDVAAGPDGSFYAGTYFDDRPDGRLYHYFPDGSIDVIAEGIGCSNGMGFSPDLSTFYHTDSNQRTIYAYDYNSTTHRQSNRRVFVTLGNQEGLPDGMTVDGEGYVWTATWGGGCVIRFDPDGKEERRVHLPATQSSAVTFGGPTLTDLYVTSARLGEVHPPGGIEPVGYNFAAHRGGELYRARNVGVAGKPEFETAFTWPTAR
ncbi:MAG TPA: SMP-30/gluconolactonase/LRE family protein [Chloroflexota bacterium]|nr:SMP-30/gluconolactonase/LRE family protein [Chloroflexota bacterium]